MLTTVQMIRHMMEKGLGTGEIIGELTEIVDNETSKYFQLTLMNIEAVQSVYYDDMKLSAAFFAARRKE